MAKRRKRPESKRTDSFENWSSGAELNESFSLDFSDGLSEYSGFSTFNNSRSQELASDSADHVSVDFDREYPPLTDQWVQAFGAPRPLRVYSTYPVTDITTAERQVRDSLRSLVRSVLESTASQLFKYTDEIREPSPSGGSLFGHELPGAIADRHTRELYSHDVLLSLHSPRSCTGCTLIEFRAASHGMPVLIIAPHDVGHSPMLDHLPTRLLQLYSIPADRDRDANARQFRSFVMNLIPQFLEARHYRDCSPAGREYDANIEESVIHTGRKLRKQRLLLGLTIEQLSVRTNLSSTDLFWLEASPVKFLELTFEQGSNLTHALGTSVKLVDGQISVTGACESDNASKFRLTKNSEQSLDNLICAYDLLQFRPVDPMRVDCSVVALWSAHVAQLNAVAMRNGDASKVDSVIASDEWVRRVQKVQPRRS